MLSRTNRDSLSLSSLNRRAEALLHCRRAQVLGQSIWQVFLQYSRTFIETSFRAANTKQTPLIFEAACLPDYWYEVRLHLHRLGLAVYLQDMTDLQKTRFQAMEGGYSFFLTLNLLTAITLKGIDR